ncbi:MAG: glycosyltransferase family 4 protein [Fibrobacter sp.]|jgi:teichuronic acid biosynthesis glycosyltransferase TuaC|nr:glycosyltransferase family 4 protein [Fibrobacter sp.]
MNVCIITSSFPAFKGHFQSPFIYSLADALSKRVSVDVVCPFYLCSESQEECWGDVRIHRFKYLPLKMQTLISGGGIPSNFKKSFFAKLQLPLFFLYLFIKSLKYARGADVIHAQWSLTAMVGVLLKKIYKKPLVLTERGSSLNAAMKYGFTRVVLRWILENCDYITANSFNQISIIKSLGFKDNVCAVPNGIDTERFRPEDRSKVREKLGFPVDKRIVLFVGWLVKGKGVDYLLKSVDRIRVHFPDILVVIVGGGLEFGNYKRFVLENGLDKNVVLTGPKMADEIPEFMNAADIFVLPSLSEGRPNVVAEAMACGLPVIATAVNGTPELIEDGIDGLLIEPENSKSIEDAVLRLLGESGLYDAIKSRARESILRKKITWDTSAITFCDIYKKVLYTDNREKWPAI